MSFAIDLKWPDARGERDDDVADVRIRVHDHSLTQILHLNDRSYRDSFRASTVSLAFWFGDNWWRLRCEPLGASPLATTDWRLRHELSSGSSNELWPPIMIYGGGPRVLIEPSLIRSREEAGLRYIEQQPFSVPGVDRFLEQVADACARHPDAQALRELLRQLRIERADDELAGWRRLEACLGFDPDHAPVAVIEALVAREDELGEEAVEEAAVAAPGESAPAILDAVLEAARSSDCVVSLATVTSIAHIPDPRGLTPWRAAEEAASTLRNVLGLPDIIDGNVFADLFGARWGDLKQATATARNLPYAARAPQHEGTSKLALKMGPQIDRRFELARIIGDALWTRGRGMGVVSRARTDRQKYQRAFAQSLLCPMRSLRKFVDLSNPTEAQIRDAALHHRVREAVIITILENRGFLIRENRDLLEVF